MRPALPKPIAHIDQEPRLRAHSRRELLADSLVHAIGIGAAIIGAIALLIVTARQDDAGKLIAVAIYAIGLLAMITASAAYNLGYATRFRVLLRRMDHSAILIMIAGTYTPFTTQWHVGWTRIGLTLGVWTLVGMGVAIKMVWPALFERIGVALFLVLGWASLLVLGPVLPDLPASALLSLVTGGVLYTLGLVFHLRENWPFQNAIWHVFVLGAASCHYAAVMTGVVFV